MPTVTIDWTSSGDELDQYYQNVREYLRLKYHTYRDPLPHIPMDDKTAAEMDQYNYLAVICATTGLGQ